MARFLIEIPHEDQHAACVKALHALEAYGSHFVTHADWGCAHGTHSGWLIADLDTRAEAQRLVPPEFRGDARIVQLRRFTRDQLVAMVEELET
jgi:hypothetical protein